MSSRWLNSLITIFVFILPVGVFFGITQLADREQYVKVEEVATSTPEITAFISFVNGKPLSEDFFNTPTSLTYDDARQPFIEEVEGLQVAYLDFGDGSLLRADDPYFPLIISDAKSKADILVIYAAGTLDQDLAYRAIESGADIVSGSSARKLSSVEEYMQGLIFYNPLADSGKNIVLNIAVTQKGIQSFATSTEDVLH